MEKIKKIIPLCLGSVDLIFNGASQEIAYSEKIKREIIDEKISTHDVVIEFHKYLKSKNCTSEHIKMQMNKINDFFLN